MRKHFLFLLALVAIFSIASASFAVPPFNPPNPCGNHGNNCNPGNGQGGGAGDVDVDVDSHAHAKASANAVAAAVANAEQEQTQGQQQGQIQGQQQGLFSDDDVTVDGDDVKYEAPDLPVNSAAPVFAGACSQGVSGQGMGFGASAASGNPVCDYVAVGGAYVAAGDRDKALDAIGKAEKAADWRNTISKIRNVLTLGLL